MTPDKLREQLNHIEAILRQYQLWQAIAPPNHALHSEQPFCLDTLQPCEWLQWVFLQRMRTLLDNNLPLPTTCTLTPYYELALANDHPAQATLLAALGELDALFNKEPTT